jgi:hypothetical protein
MGKRCAKDQFVSFLSAVDIYLFDFQRKFCILLNLRKNLRFSVPGKQAGHIPPGYGDFFSGKSVRQRFF